MIQVTAAIIEAESRFLIARKKRGDLSGLWEFPGGKVEPGETAEECLVREIEEEFGIMIKIDQYLATSQYSYPHISIELIGYLASYLSGELNPTDHDRVEWVSVGEMNRYNFAPADLPLIQALQEKTNNLIV